MTLEPLCDNKGTSAVCQQKFRTALTLNYLYGLNSFKAQLRKYQVLPNFGICCRELEEGSKLRVFVHAYAVSSP